jgi:hypothetical protein
VHRFQRAVILATLVAVAPALGLDVRAEVLRFAWPDGASAKVQARSEGHRTGPDGEAKWNMTSEFTTQVRRTGDRVLVTRADFSGWKGTFPPSFGGGAEQFTDMIPTLIISGDGKFLGIEGHETARKLMNQVVEQSGGLDGPSRSLFETIKSDASLRAIASDYWSMTVALWEDVELDPEAAYEFHNVTAVPQLGGGELTINGTINFVKETPCTSVGGGQRRCAHFRAESAADKAQVLKLVEALMKRAVGGNPVITGWDQRVKADIVVDKATMLPQQFTLTRFSALDVSVQGRTERGSEESTKTYTFTWTLPDGGQKK